MEKNGDPQAALEKGRLLFARGWQFWRSVPSIAELPEFGGIELAFAGRSNVGKSSLINALTRTKGLARTSNTPGRTQQLNYFLPDAPEASALTIVDMPGYGFAKAPKPIVEEWNELILAYLKGRANLRRIFVLIDSRHGIKANDLDVLTTLDKSAVSYQIILTKTDKIKPPAIAKLMEDVLSAIKKRPAAYPEVIATSSEKGEGIEDLRAALASFT